MVRELMTQGLFITFEGIEGSGKSTQLSRLRSWLEGQGREVVSIREPGGTTIGNRIRGLLLDPEATDMCDQTEMLLFAASRAQLVREVVRPALSRGAIVLCDRYLHSSIAYQGWARDLGRERVLGINSAATDGLLPDQVILIDIPVDVAMDRARRRGGLDRIEREDLAFHEAVRQGYLAERELDPSLIALIDGNQAEETILLEIIERLDAALSPAEA
jgi:dTMP kinase